MSCVLDASFAVGATAVDDRDGEQTLKQLAEQGPLLAPTIFWHEVASALRNMTLARVLKPETRAPVLRRLRALAISVEAPSPDMSRVIETSDKYQLTIYDAAYLELAIRTGSALATRDKGLIAAAPRAGVRLVEAA